MARPPEPLDDVEQKVGKSGVFLKAGKLSKVVFESLCDLNQKPLVIVPHYYLFRSRMRAGKCPSSGYDGQHGNGGHCRHPRGPDWVLGSFLSVDGVDQKVWKSGGKGSGGGFDGEGIGYLSPHPREGLLTENV